MTLHARAPADELVHHSDRGVQYLSIRHTERLAEAGIERSVGSVGDSYDNALAETVIGLYKTEVIRRRGPWRNIEAVEYATLEWWTGSTVAAFSDRSATSHRSSSRRRTIAVRRTQPRGLDSSNRVSGESGAVHGLETVGLVSLSAPVLRRPERPPRPSSLLTLLAPARPRGGRPGTGE